MTGLDRGLLTGGNAVDWSRTSQLLVIETIIAGDFFSILIFAGILPPRVDLLLWAAPVKWVHG